MEPTKPPDPLYLAASRRVSYTLYLKWLADRLERNPQAYAPDAAAELRYISESNYTGAE